VRSSAHLLDHNQLERSPAEGLETPRKEKNSRLFLQTDEYSRMLSLAGGTRRDCTIPQVFLQKSVRVSELCETIIYVKLDREQLADLLEKLCKRTRVA
jgi:site-specific recombinase XerC